MMMAVFASTCFFTLLKVMILGLSIGVRLSVLVIICWFKRRFVGMSLLMTYCCFSLFIFTFLLRLCPSYSLFLALGILVFIIL